MINETTKRILETLTVSPDGGTLRDFRQEYPVIDVLRRYHPGPEYPGFEPGMYESFGQVSVDHDDYFARVKQSDSATVPRDIAEAIQPYWRERFSSGGSREEITPSLLHHLFGEHNPIMRFSYHCSDDEIRTFMKKYCDGLGFKVSKPRFEGDGDIYYQRDDGPWLFYPNDQTVEQCFAQRISEGTGNILLWTNRIRDIDASVDFVRMFLDGISKGPLDDLIYHRNDHTPLVLRYVKPGSQYCLPLQAHWCAGLDR